MQTNKEKVKININEPLATVKFGWDLSLRLNRKRKGLIRPVILICVGTDRSTGDSLGPLVGSKMKSFKQNFYTIYGTLEKPVHATNLKETLDEIRKKFEDPLIIAVDACLGRSENVGCINIGDGALSPGAGVNKILPAVGDINIAGIVNVGGFMEYLVLQNTRLHLVMKMADTIVEGLLNAAGHVEGSNINIAVSSLSD